MRSLNCNRAAASRPPVCPALRPQSSRFHFGSIVADNPGSLLPSDPLGSKSQTNKKDRTVHRPYGGVLSGANVKNRIVRAFLIEEQKIVKKVLKMQAKKSKK